MKKKRFFKSSALALVIVVLAYLVFAYVVMPWDWLHYERRHPALEDLPHRTYTADGIPGDPLNVGFVATEDELKLAMLAAKWFPADSLTLKSCLKIAADAVLSRPYEDAPVSNLYLWERKEDLAFEQPVGDNPRKRHHVRFWQSKVEFDDGRPIWIGSVTFDRSVGLSHTTGQITHHIDPDIDAERDNLLSDIQKTGRLEKVFWVSDFQQQSEGKNGGGDPYFTDRRLAVGVLRASK